MHSHTGFTFSVGKTEISVIFFVFGEHRDTNFGPESLWFRFQIQKYESQTLVKKTKFATVKRNCEPCCYYLSNSLGVDPCRCVLTMTDRGCHVTAWVHTAPSFASRRHAQSVLKCCGRACVLLLSWRPTEWAAEIIRKLQIATPNYSSMACNCAFRSQESGVQTIRMCSPGLEDKLANPSEER